MWFIINVVIFINNVVYNPNACRLTVYEIHDYILFCLYLAVILRNSVNNKFIKLVEQQLKLINYSESDLALPLMRNVISWLCF